MSTDTWLSLLVDLWINGYGTQELIPSNGLFTGDGMVMEMDGSATLSFG